jgi:Tol biopolymer transport system component/predicted Ser/Thr protein kinase
VSPRDQGHTAGESDFPLGSRIGHYELLALIGRGGMGAVYRARDLVLDRQVALKTPLPSGGIRPEHRKRFLREARAASKLSHPGIVTVFEAFEHGDTPWFAMELVDGTSLHALLAEAGPLQVDTIIRHAETLASALHAAHEKGVLHRDLKPSNILISTQGEARITDFGLARFMVGPKSDSPRTDAETLTIDGALVGTIPYMAPEQILGDTADARSDIFSLGAVLYEMCTGKRPFVGSSDGQVMNAILHTTPRRVGNIRSDIPRGLERIVGRCLARRPEKRYQSASELAADLQGLRATSTGRRRRLPRRFPGWGRKAWVPVAVLILVSVTAVWWFRGPKRARALPSFHPTQVTGQGVEPAISPDGEEIAFTASEGSNQDIWLVDARGGQPLRITSEPSAERSASWFPDGSSIVFVSDRGGRKAIWKVPRLGGAAVQLVANAEDPAVSPDGSRIAFVRKGADGFTRVAVAPLADIDRAQILTGDNDGLWDHRNPAWSPDGATLCYQDFRDLWLVPADGGVARPLTADDAPNYDPQWSSNGRFVYYGSFRDGLRALWRIDTDGGEPVRLTMGTVPEQTPSLSRDGRRLAYSTFHDRTAILLVDLETGARSRIEEDRLLSEPTIAPDRSAVVMVFNRWNTYDLWRVPLEDNRPSGPPSQVNDLLGSCAHPVFSPDGKWLAFHRVASKQRDIWVMPAQGGQATRFTDHKAVDVHPEFSPDGSQLAFVSDRSGSLQLWLAPVSDGRRTGDPRQITNQPGSVTFPSWSPDGSEIAFVNHIGDVSDVWVAPIRGSGQARRLTEGAGALVVCWNRASGMVFVCGDWGNSAPVVQVVSPAGEVIGKLSAASPSSPTAEILDLDVSGDGRLMALWEREQLGSVCVLETESGSF